MISIGFMASCIARGLFMVHDEDRGIVVAAVVQYIDDLPIIANECFIGQIKDQMKETFQMHDIGSVSFYLGINIEYNLENYMLDSHQHSYILSILAKFKMDQSRPVATPMVTKLHKRKPDEEAWDPTIYQSMIGSLMYAMTATRPDVASAIVDPSRFNHDQTNQRMIALKRMSR